MRRRGAAVASVFVAGILAIAGPAAGVDGHGGAAELDAAQRELADAERSLDEVETAVQRTGAEVAALDERLREASTELSQVEQQLEAAETALAEARREERAAAATLASVDAELDDALAAWEHNRDRLRDRAIHTFKHGAGVQHELLMRGVTGAGDWHEVAVTMEAAARLAADEQELVAGSVEFARTTSGLRRTAGAARSDAVAAARTAIDEERRVAALVDRQARIVTDVDAELRDRARILAELEADADARAALVKELERRVTELQVSSRRVFVPIQADLDVHGPPPPWADRLPAHGRPYAAAFEAIGARHGVDGRLVAALVWAESNFRPDAVSHAGALGLAQLMPGTARGLGVDPRDPLQNVDGGTRYLRSQLDRFGSAQLALAAYNAGPGRVERAGGVPNIVETQLYVVRVLDLYEGLSG